MTAAARTDGPPAAPAVMPAFKRQHVSPAQLAVLAVASHLFQIAGGADTVDPSNVTTQTAPLLLEYARRVSGAVIGAGGCRGTSESLAVLGQRRTALGAAGRVRAAHFIRISGGLPHVYFIFFGRWCRALLREEFPHLQLDT